MRELNISYHQRANSVFFCHLVRVSWSWVKVWTLIDLGIVNKAFGGNTSDEVLQEWITDCDCDGDDKIDFGEFVECRLKHAKKEKHGLHDLFEGV